MMFQRLQRLDSKRLRLLQKRAEYTAALDREVRRGRKLVAELLREAERESARPELDFEVLANRPRANLADTRISKTPTLLGSLTTTTQEMTRLLRGAAKTEARLDRVQKKVRRMLKR